MLRRVGLAQRLNVEKFRISHRLTDPILSLTPLNRPRLQQRCNASAALLRRNSVIAAHTSPTEPQGDLDKVSTPVTNPQFIGNGQTGDTPSRKHSVPSQLYLFLQSMPYPTRITEHDLEKFLKIPIIQESIRDPNAALHIARAIGSSPKPLKAIHFVHLAHVAGFRIRQNVYQEVAFHLANKRLWSGVVAIVELGQEFSETTTGRLLNWKLRALVELRQFGTLNGMLREFKQYAQTPRRRTYHLLLSAFVQNRDVGSVDRILNLMKADNIPPDASTDAIIATHHRSLGADLNVEKRALHSLDSLAPQTATSVVNRLMLLRIDVHDVVGAVQLLRMFENHHISSITTTSTIRQIVEQGQTTSVSVPASVRNFTPNADTYVIFINFMAKQGSFEDGVQVFRGMLDVGIQPTAAAVTALVNLLFAAENPDSAVDLVARMCTNTMSKALLGPLLSSGVFEDAMQFPWDPSGIQPTIKVFNMLLRRLLPISGLKAVRPILQVMGHHDIIPNTATLEVLLAYLYKDLRAQPGQLIDTVRKFTSGELQPSLRHLHFILASLLRHDKYLLYGEGWKGKAEGSHRTLHRRSYPEHLIARIVAPFDPTSAVWLPSGVNYLARSDGLWKRITQSKETSDAVGFGQRMRYESMVNLDPEAAKMILQVLMNRGIRPNEYHFAALMEGLSYSDDLDGAWEVLRTAELIGCTPNAAMFTVLISGYAKKGETANALHTFDRMMERGIRPDVASIDAVASAFFTVGEYRHCRHILMRLWHLIQPFPPEFRNISLENLVRNFRRLDKTNRQPCRTPEDEGQARQQELTKIRRVWRTLRQESGISEWIKQPAEDAS